MTLALGLLLLAIGDAVYSLPAGIDIGDTGLTLADPLYVVGSVVMVLGALRLKGSQVGERDLESTIDAVQHRSRRRGPGLAAAHRAPAHRRRRARRPPASSAARSRSSMSSCWR